MLQQSQLVLQLGLLQCKDHVNVDSTASRLPVKSI
jgi:hypothetical protein